MYNQFSASNYIMKASWQFYGTLTVAEKRHHHSSKKPGSIVYVPDVRPQVGFHEFPDSWNPAAANTGQHPSNGLN